MLTIAPSSLGHHAAHDIFGQHDRRERVEPQQRLDVGVRHVRQQPSGSDAGVVDEAIDRPAPLLETAHEGGNGGDVGQIERLEMQRAGAADFRRGLGERLARLAGDADHAIALARQPLRDGEADAAARAGDEHVIHGGPPCRRR